MQTGVRVRIYCDVDRRAGHAPLATAIVQLLWREHAAGVTVLRGMQGFGGGRNPSEHDRRVELVDHSPQIVEWIDSPAAFDRIWPKLRAIVGDTLTTRDTVELLRAPHHRLRLLPGQVPVADVMRTDLVVVAPQTPLEEVVRIMLGEEIRFIPVVDGDALVGVITNSDLVERGGLSVRLELQHALGRPPSVSPRTAQDVMTRGPRTVLPSQTIHDAARLMIEHRVKRVPVVDHGRLVGLVSRIDLLYVVASVFPAAAHAPAPAGARTIGDIAAPTVPTVLPQTPVADTLDAVVSTRLNRAVVIDADRRVLGIVTDAEVLRRVDQPDRTILDRLMRRGRTQPVEGGKTAADLMVSPVTTAPRSMPIGDAIRLMLEEQRKLLPVIDDDGRLCGMVDRADALRAVFAETMEP